MTPNDGEWLLIAIIYTISIFAVAADSFNFILEAHTGILNTLTKLGQYLAANGELVRGMRDTENKQQSRIKERAEKNLSLEGVDQEPIVTITESSLIGCTMALVDAHYKLPPLEFPQRSDTAKEAFLRAFPQASLKFRGAFALAKLRAYDLTRTVLDQDKRLTQRAEQLRMLDELEPL